MSNQKYASIFQVFNEDHESILLYVYEYCFLGGLLPLWRFVFGAILISWGIIRIKIFFYILREDCQLVIERNNQILKLNQQRILFQIQAFLIFSKLQLLYQKPQRGLKAMHSKSASIKSKKQKLNEIRQQKQLQKSLNTQKQQRSRVEVVVDSDSAHSESVQVIKVDKKQPAKQQKPYLASQTLRKAEQVQYNNFNYSKLKKIEGSLRKQNKPAVLDVSQCLQTIEESAVDDNRAISYKKIGINGKRTISENYLKTRLQKIQEQTIPTIALANKSTVEASVDQQKNQQQTKPIKRFPRYFDDQPSNNSENQDQLDQDQEPHKKTVKCYRCGEKGHIARLCNQRQVLKCVYCLGGHHSSQCTDKLCHRCNERGHIKQQCKNDKIQCRRCRNLGHVAKNCGKVLMMNFSADREKQIVQRYSKQDLQKLKCLKCNGYKDSKGHFNCHQYCKKMPKIYEQAYIIL